MSALILGQCAKAAKALRDHTRRGCQAPTLQLRLNGKLEAEATSDLGTVRASFEDGDSWTDKIGRQLPLSYTCKGSREAEVLVNPSFLLAALEGMDSETVTLAAGLNTLYLGGKDTEAVVMQVRG